MEQDSISKGFQNFALFAISIGVLLVIAGLIAGTSIFVALGDGILIHTLNDVRTNVIRFVFSFLIPLIGGIVLISAGVKLIKIDSAIVQKHTITRAKRKIIQQKEHMMRVFLNNDERAVMGLVKDNPDGILQSDLVIKTGYSKVKMHRILKSLEIKGLVKRGRFGITNRVLLNS